MKHYVLSPDAAADLVWIWRYIRERGSKEATDRVEGVIRAKLAALASAPGIGHQRSDLASVDIRFFPVYSYLIIYRDAPDSLQVIAILHGARDLQAILNTRK